jgi:hypothetical protein
LSILDPSSFEKQPTSYQTFPGRYSQAAKEISYWIGYSHLAPLWKHFGRAFVHLRKTQIHLKGSMSALAYSSHRDEAGNERFLRERSSEPLGPEFCAAYREVHLLPSLEGCAVTSAYRWAQHVGGDFFQLIKQEGDSGLLSLGDASGKDLPAARSPPASDS